jgi:hypothetical protein
MNVRLLPKQIMELSTVSWIIIIIICLAGNYVTNFVLKCRGHKGELPFLIEHILWPIALLVSLCIPPRPVDPQIDPKEQHKDISIGRFMRRGIVGEDISPKDIAGAKERAKRLTP